MNIKPFELERYFAKYEFTAKYLLSSSDCDGLLQSDLIDMADSETRKLWDNLTLGYTDSLGNLLLRDEIGKLYTNINPNNILVTVPEEGIFLALNSILEKDDHIICTFPGYQSLYEIAETLGCEITKWKPDEENGWKFDIDFLRKNIKSNTKLIIVNFPHNPTGYLPTKEEFQEIINIAKENDIYLFSDEMYRFLEIDENNRLSSACELYDKAITLFGMSKTFGMAGVRIGWIITKDEELYKKMATLKDYTTICSSAPSEILSLIALKNKDKIIQKNIDLIQSNLSILEKFLNRHKDKFEWVKPKAGTICFPKLKLNMSASGFALKVVENANIMMLPSSVYGYDNKHLRIGFGRENFSEVLKKFEEYLNNSL